MQLNIRLKMVAALNGGPFLEDETKVTFDGIEAEVISRSGVFLKFALYFHWFEQFK